MERKHPAHTRNRFEFNRSTVVFVTVCTKDRRPILARADVHECLRRAWTVADGWRVGKYILLPDHIHFFCCPRDDEAPRLSAWVQYWKSTASRSWPRPEEHPIWQRDFWDRQLRTGESYEIKADYVQGNAARHNLVTIAKDWPFQGELNRIHWDEV